MLINSNRVKTTSAAAGVAVVAAKAYRRHRRCSNVTNSIVYVLALILFYAIHVKGKHPIVNLVSIRRQQSHIVRSNRRNGKKNRKTIFFCLWIVSVGTFFLPFRRYRMRLSSVKNNYHRHLSLQTISIDFFVSRIKYLSHVFKLAHADRKRNEKFMITKTMRRRHKETQKWTKITRYNA